MGFSLFCWLTCCFLPLCCFFRQLPSSSSVIRPAVFYEAQQLLNVHVALCACGLTGCATVFAGTAIKCLNGVAGASTVNCTVGRSLTKDSSAKLSNGSLWQWQKSISTSWRLHCYTSTAKVAVAGSDSVDCRPGTVVTAGRSTDNCRVGRSTAEVDTARHISCAGHITISALNSYTKHT